MTPSDKAPLVGWMILEDYCEDMSQWDGVIAFPDPTGANLAWQDPIKMIEYEAYDALAKRCAELEAELEKIHAGSLWREAIQLRVENAELRAALKKACVWFKEYGELATLEEALAREVEMRK